MYFYNASTVGLQEDNETSFFLRSEPFLICGAWWVKLKYALKAMTAIGGKNKPMFWCDFHEIVLAWDPKTDVRYLVVVVLMYIYEYFIIFYNIFMP